MFDLGSRMIGAAARVLRASDWAINRMDPAGLRYLAAVSVRMHWFVIAVCFVLVVYRPPSGSPDYAAYWTLYLALLGFNACIHYRLWSGKSITWHWIFMHFVVDAAVVSAATAVGGGFGHFFIHLLYYPVLAGFAVLFSSFRLNMAFVTVVALVYLAVSLSFGEGINTETREEKPLFARIMVMYAVAAAANLISRFERTRWRAAVERERALHRERTELSRTIHDTAAQSAYVIGLGIDAATQLVGDSNQEVKTRLEATAKLSKTAIWQLRHPIDMGRIFDGRALGRTLKSHVSTFTQVTSVQADLVQIGDEPPLPVETKSMLFSIAHNALTNSFRHAEANRVLVELDFGGDDLRLSVSDDGKGLPDDYPERGHGFANMRADAKRLGARLEVDPRGPAGGAVMTCLMRLARSG